MSRYGMRIMGMQLLAMPVLIVISWTGLMISFDYPDILRKPTAIILQQYEEGGVTLRMYWAGMVVSSLLIIPIVMLLYRLTSPINRSLSLVAAGIGFASAIFHVVGFSRWLFVVDSLVAQYVDNEHLSPARREAIEVIFDALHTYLGVTIGETLGFATMGVWAIMMAITLYQSGHLPRWAAVISVLCGIGIAAGILEWVGWSAAADVNAYAYQLWILILACLGVSFIVRKE
ncbi:hypothetical protein PCCS19_19340 [Paenibacillus sp. CCS19]|uniref:DUF4386 domain-containing protein n=1 Tax=Paenibacillus sp. CCS19 TaxID=3158387 RepID=UPI00256BC8C7|nr:DUF4386 domain-containing protein [Paenibacillus cellulosilyticus]GMK38880.1 hypothetical protein PCCS19_19340 [Paenibacillus cellulosilyticus]